MEVPPNQIQKGEVSFVHSMYHGPTSSANGLGGRYSSWACGVRNRDMSRRYLEVYSYQYSAKYFSFAQDESEYNNKVLSDTIKISVVLDLKWGDISNDF